VLGRGVGHIGILHDRVRVLFRELHLYVIQRGHRGGSRVVSSWESSGGSSEMEESDEESDEVSEGA